MEPNSKDMDLMSLVQEEARPTPQDKREHTGMCEAVKPLAAHIARLKDGKCIRIRKILGEPIIAALRTTIEREHSCRVIIRRRTGETYLWRGENVQNIDLLGKR